MAFNLDSITSGIRVRPPRIICLGVPKIGKSEWAAKSDRAIFIPIKGEEGIDGIDVPQFPTCGTYGDVMSCLYSLYSEKHAFGTAVIDSASTAEKLVWDETCARNVNKNDQPAPVDSIEKVGGGYAKGYTEACRYWGKITEALDMLRNERNMASIIIGHVKTKRFDDPCGDSYDQYQFNIHDKAAALLFQWADAIVFANTKVAVKKTDVGFNKEISRAIDVSGGGRFLYTQKNPAYPAGGRGVYGRLPAELPLDWGAYMAAVQNVTQLEEEKAW